MIWIALLFAGGFATLLGPGGKVAVCLLSPTCGGIAWQNMQVYETALIGIDWNNMDDEYDDFKFQTGLIMFAVDFVLYTLLGLYFDQVWPSRYGSKKPFYFICLKSSYSCFENDNNENEENIDNDDAKDLKTRRILSRKFSLMDTDVYEDVSQQYDEMEPAIQIRHLRKHFEGGICSSGDSVVKAVNGVSLDMYIGECFCLLGHNGAGLFVFCFFVFLSFLVTNSFRVRLCFVCVDCLLGKTTTISMLSGLIDITSGDALILGKNVKSELNEARKYMGICPQKDVLFPLLTVREHLQMYAKLKGVCDESLEKEVEQTIVDVNLKHKRDSFPTQLSGGQKRALSLGIAFIGKSKVVFLDEPTSVKYCVIYMFDFSVYILFFVFICVFFILFF